MKTTYAIWYAGTNVDVPLTLWETLMETGVLNAESIITYDHAEGSVYTAVLASALVNSQRTKVLFDTIYEQRTLNALIANAVDSVMNSPRDLGAKDSAHALAQQFIQAIMEYLAEME